MPWIDLVDKNGHTIKVEESSDGLYFPPKPIPVTSDEQIKAIRTLDIRDDDVIILSYPKSGTHWLWEIVRMIVDRRAEYHENRMPVFMLDITKKEDADTMSSPRVLCTHFRFRHIPQQILSKKVKVLFVHRNPKDIFVSHYCMYSATQTIADYKGSWEDFLELCLQGKVPYNSWLDYVQDWDKELKAHPEFTVYHVHYEDMKKDPLGSVKGVAKFLGSDISDDLCAAIAETCCFDKMKRAELELKNEKLKAKWRDGMHGIFRKGEVGDWKNWFTVAQNELFEQIHQEKMKDLASCFQYIDSA